MDRLFSALGKHWKETTNWLLYTLVGGLVPVWGGMVLFGLFSKPLAFSAFSSNGEFAIYSAAILAPSLYLILKDLSTSNFLYRHFFSLVCIFGLGVSMILFAGVTAVNTGGLGAVTLNQGFLRRVTIILFLISVIVAFLVTALDSARMGIDIKQVRQERESQEQNLEKEFDHLKRGEQ